MHGAINAQIPFLETDTAFFADSRRSRESRACKFLRTWTTEDELMTIQIRRSNTTTSVIRLLVAGVFLALKIGSAHAAIPNTERAVLDALFTQTGSSAVLSGNGWEGTAGTECSWLGIGCDTGSTHVIGIELANQNLTGTLPAISALTALQSFHIGSNNLSGLLPALTALTALQDFNVSRNQFTGSIPSLAGLTALQTFNVANNSLSGGVPDLSSLTSLHDILLGHNGLTGPTPIPPNPSALSTASSSLCPNFLGPISKPQSAADLIWDDATDNDPWTEGCSAAPVAEVPVALPTFSPIALLILVGLFGIWGCATVRYRAR